VGYELDVLIDEAVDGENFQGRIYADAPEIDGTVFVSGGGINVGDLVPVEITGRDGYDLTGAAC
jgi:ribosomal protein S12 methylthiotransferase